MEPDLSLEFLRVVEEAAIACAHTMGQGERHKSDQVSFLEEAGPVARLGMPARIAAATSGPIVGIAIRLNDSTDETVRSMFASIGPALDRVDAWIGDGVIGGAQPNAADFQIGASVALLLCFEDVAAAIGQRPAAGLARRLYPWYPGRVSPSFPSGLRNGSWLACAASPTPLGFRPPQSR